MNKSILAFSIIFLFSSGSLFAQSYSIDVGKVIDLYTEQSGKVAVRIEGGFVNANADGQCPTNNGWAGNYAADPFFKSVLLTARTTGKPARLVIQGCEAGGGWLKIVSVYLGE